jgi:uncharacterized protein
MELAFLFGVGLLAAAVTAISGGGGLIAVPALLAAGFPAVDALALNRASDVAVTAGAAPTYARAGAVDWRLAAWAALLLASGGALGASVVLHIPPAVLPWVVVAVAVGALALLLLRPSPPKAEGGGQPAALSRAQWALGSVALLACGVYNGAFAMGGATLAILAMAYILRLGLVAARGTEVVAVVPESVVSATILWLGSTLGGPEMGAVFAGGALGAWLGARLAVTRGAAFVRGAMVAVTCGLLSKVAWDLLAASE